MQYFFMIKTKTTENDVSIINSTHLYAVDIDNFVDALMDTVANAIYTSSGYYQLVFVDEKGDEYSINYLSELRDFIRESLEYFILDFSIKIFDYDTTDIEIWLEKKEYKTTTSAGTVPIKVIDPDDVDNVLFYNEYDPQDLLSDRLDFFIEMIYDFFEKGFVVILNDVRLNNIGYNQMLEIKQDENRKMYLEMEYENENKIKEKVLLYHEEYLKKGIEKLRYEEKKKALLIEK